MSETDGEEPEPLEARKIPRLIGSFLLEWVILVVGGAAITITVDAAWSLAKPETAVSALTHIRQGFAPWACGTFVGLALYKFLKGDWNASFMPLPFD